MHVRLQEYVAHDLLLHRQNDAVLSALRANMDDHQPPELPDYEATMATRPAARHYRNAVARTPLDAAGMQTAASTGAQLDTGALSRQARSRCLRYKAIGNAMAVPCVAWLERRLLQGMH